MIKILIFVSCATAITAQTLSGDAFKEAIDILLYGLDQLNVKGGTFYMAGDINSASRISADIGYRFDTILFDYNNVPHECTVEITTPNSVYSTISVKCAGVDAYTKLTYN